MNMDQKEHIARVERMTELDPDLVKRSATAVRELLKFINETLYKAIMDKELSPPFRVAARDLQGKLFQVVELAHRREVTTEMNSLIKYFTLFATTLIDRPSILNEDEFKARLNALDETEAAIVELYERVGVRN